MRATATGLVVRACVPVSLQELYEGAARELAAGDLPPDGGPAGPLLLRIPTLGGPVDVRVPAGSQHGDTIRIAHRGLPGDPPGDQLVTLRVVVARAPERRGPTRIVGRSVLVPQQQVGHRGDVASGRGVMLREERTEPRLRCRITAS